MKMALKQQQSVKSHTHPHKPTMTHVLIYIYYMRTGACVVQVVFKGTLKWCYSCTSYVCYSLWIMTGNVKHGGAS